MLSVFTDLETIKLTQTLQYCLILDLDAQVGEMISKQTDGQWSCIQCGYSSSVKTNVKMHIEIKHVVSAGFYCPLCQLFCPNRKSLRNHMTRKHNQNARSQST